MGLNTPKEPIELDPNPKYKGEYKGVEVNETEGATIDLNKDGKADVSAQFLITSTLIAVSIFLAFLATLLLTGTVTWEQVMQLVDKAGMAITGVLGMGLGAGGATAFKRK